MPRTRKHRITRILALVAVVTMLAPAAASAYRLQGRVVNGTTEAPVSPATIKVVNPSSGMLTETEVQTIDELGHFVVDDLSEQVPAYLLRVDFQGVNYTEVVRFDGHDPQSIELRVYDRTDVWDSIRIRVPHMMISRSLDTLTVDKFVQIANGTSPPTTIYGEDARFVIYLPEDLIEINGLSVRSLGIPLPVTPTPTGDPGFYSIDYPIKPGLTTVQLSFDVPYRDSQYLYEEPIKYDVEELLIVTQDSGIEVTSPTARIGPPEDFHGFTSYKLAALKSGENLALAFSGGSSTPSQSVPQVFIVPNQTRNVALALMVTLIVIFIVFLITVVGRGHSSAVEKEVLGLQKEELLDQLAKLDDLHRMGTVSDQIYKLKRGELMNALAGIYYRTTFKKTKTRRKAREKGAASV